MGGESNMLAVLPQFKSQKLSPNHAVLNHTDVKYEGTRHTGQVERVLECLPIQRWILWDKEQLAFARTLHIWRTFSALINSPWISKMFPHYVRSCRESSLMVLPPFPTTCQLLIFSKPSWTRCCSLCPRSWRSPLGRARSIRPRQGVWDASNTKSYKVPQLRTADTCLLSPEVGSRVKAGWLVHPNTLCVSCGDKVNI